MTSIDSIIFTICAWWRNRRIAHAMPELDEINRAEREAIRSHRPVKAIRKRRQEVMTRALREGV
ncbi:MAG: hypothetical protein DI589_11225 [Shinella sp.]|nr:MAG: hypothetical protein DI589_11225 [Shinella sp.]